MNRKEWKDFLINNELVDLKYWQPDWKIQETKTGFNLNTPKGKLKFTISKNILYFIFNSNYGDDSQQLIIKNDKIKLNNVVRHITISRFVSRVKTYGFDYDRLETILFDF